jgi:hypothetical protein
MTEIKHGIHLIDGRTHPFPGVGMVSYIVEEAPHDLTLITPALQLTYPN